MAGMFLAKRATVTIYRASVKDHCRYVDSGTRLPGACFSSAYEPAEGSNTEPGSTRTSRDPGGQGIYEVKQQSLDARSGIAQFVAYTAEEGVRKATEVADAVGDTAKNTVDDAWRAAKDANQRVRETVAGDEKEDGGGIVEDPVVDEMQNVDGPVDMADYRNIEDNFGESKKT